MLTRPVPVMSPPKTSRPAPAFVSWWVRVPPAGDHASTPAASLTSMTAAPVLKDRSRVVAAAAAPE